MNVLDIAAERFSEVPIPTPEYAAVTPETIRRLFDAVCEELAEEYQEGTRAFCRVHHPSLLAELQSVDDQMILAWRNGDLLTFKEALTRWADTHREMVDEFKES